MLRNKLLAGVTALVAFLSINSAHADYVFSGSGSNGTLVSPSETWSSNFDGGFLLSDWGSPGVSAGTVPYGESQTAFGFLITFNQGTVIDANSIDIGNNAACAGTTN